MTYTLRIRNISTSKPKVLGKFHYDTISELDKDIKKFREELYQTCTRKVGLVLEEIEEETETKRVISYTPALMLFKPLKFEFLISEVL